MYSAKVFKGFDDMDSEHFFTKSELGLRGHELFFLEMEL